MTTRQIAQGLAGLGRYGDSTLVHMQPEEVAGLQALAKTQGTSLSINPQTGLPEAFNLGGFFKSLLPVFAGAATGGAGAPLWAGIAAGAATGAVTNRKDPLMGAVMGGMGGYGGYNIGSSIGAMSGSGPTAANVAANPQGFANANAINAANQAGVMGGIDAGTNLVGIDPAVQQALTTSGANVSDEVVKSIAQQSQQSAIPYQQNLSNTLSNAKDLATFQPGAWDAYTAAGGSAMQMGMPLGGAVLGGLEPSDIYGEPMRPGQNPNEKYDPYRSLNLDTETGLRLYAVGGPVSFADGGDTGKDPAGLPGGGLGSLRGGDVAVTQGAGMLPLDVSDINAKYGLGEEASFVPAPRLGLFADNDQIEAARTAYEAQLSAAMSGRGGMGSPFGYGNFGKPNTGMNMMGRVMGSTGQGQPNMVRGMAPNSSPMAAMTRTMGGTGVGATAPTAPTAETALSRLNLNKQYADGGNVTMDSPPPPQLSRDGYGLARLQAMADSGMGYAKGGYLDGLGDGMSDSIPATIEGKQPARLADGEFVIPADVVSHLGNGSTKAGAQRLYGMLDKVRQARTGNKKQGKQIKPEKYMPA